MDSAAFQQLIALARDTAAELAATEKKVSAFKDELAHQDHRAQLCKCQRRYVSFDNDYSEAY